MEYKEIVIRILEKDYDKMCRGELVDTILIAIKNGTPLPKGHGRLIILSEDAIKREQMTLTCQKWISEVGLSNATVAIIEADKEGK